MGCRAQPVRYPISRTVQQMTRETRMGQPSYTEFRILPTDRHAAFEHINTGEIDSWGWSHLHGLSLLYLHRRKIHAIQVGQNKLAHPRRTLPI